MAYLGVDIGASKLLACAVDREGAIRLRLRRESSRALAPDAALSAIEELAARAGTAIGPPSAIGVGFPGLVDAVQGIARSSVMLDGWRDVPLVAMLERRLGVACALDNDVNAAALHEQLCRKARDMLFVSVGTGIGGALVLDGRLRRGQGFAGEIGHVSIDPAGRACDCGRRGCVNRYASGSAIEAAAGLPPGGLRAGASANGPTVQAAVAAAARALGAAIGDTLNLLDLPLVVLGGGVAELGPSYIAMVAECARRECFAEIGRACVFESARGGYQAGALGAALLAARRLRAANGSESAADQP